MNTLHTTIGRPVGQAVQSIARMSETRGNQRASLLTDVVVSVLLLWLGWRYSEEQAGVSLLIVAAGLLLFTFVEYSFHRWLMHGSVPLLAPGHRRHHEDPLGFDAMPFFLPPVFLLILVGLFSLALPAGQALLLAAGLAIGYAAYGLSHALIHALRFRHPLARRWAANHHVHHFHPDSNFGVTTALWDVVLGTRRVRSGRGGAGRR